MGYPYESDVRSGVVYGASNELTGELIGCVDATGVNHGYPGLLDAWGVIGSLATGILDGDGEYHEYGILEIAGLFQRMGIVAPNTHGFAYGDGILASPEGLYYEFGILDGEKAYQGEVGILDDSGVAHESGILNAVGAHHDLTYAHETAGGTLTLPGGADVQAEAPPYGIGGDSETPEYPTTATSKAEQLAEDEAAVTAAQDAILETAAPLGVSGALPQAKVIESHGGTYHDPENAEVLKDADVGVSPRVGTFEEAVRNTDPGEEKVLVGVNYRIQNVDKTGMVETALASVCTEERLARLDVVVSSRATPSDVTTAHSTTDGKVDAAKASADAAKASADEAARPSDVTTAHGTTDGKVDAAKASADAAKASADAAKASADQAARPSDVTTAHATTDGLIGGLGSPEQTGAAAAAAEAIRGGTRTLEDLAMPADVRTTVIPGTLQVRAGTFTLQGASQQTLDLPAGYASTLALRLVDADEEPVDLSEADLVLRAVKADGEDLFVLAEGDGIQITDDEDGQFTIAVQSEQAEAGRHKYELGDSGGETLYAKGDLVFRATFGLGGGD